MNPFAILTDVSPAAMLVVRWTVLLSLAWMAHWALAGRNPRWQVLLWRMTMVGIPLIAALSWAPPLIKWRLANTKEFSRKATPQSTTVGTPSPASSLQLTHTRPTIQSGRAESIPQANPNDIATFDHKRTFKSHRTEQPKSTPIINPVATRGADRTKVSSSNTPWKLAWLMRNSWLFSAWIVGSVLLSAWLALAMWQLRRIIRRSKEAPEWVIRECQDIANRLGCTSALSVRSSSEIPSPCLAGFIRPVILLPERQCLIDAQEDLQAIMAHEISHVQGHDVPWNLGAHLVSIILWFHPWVWRLRAVHAAACDTICDATAASILGDVSSYTRILARLALQDMNSPPSLGLAMARTPDVLRRIHILNAFVFKAPLLRRFVFPSVFLATGVMVLIGGFGFTRADQQAKITPPLKAPAEPSAKVSKGRLEIEAVTADTARPLEGVSILYHGEFDGRSRTGTLQTDKQGKATLEWPADAIIDALSITARKPLFVPIRVEWTAENQPIKLSETRILTFAPATSIGGLVKNEAGQPIAGAEVVIDAPVTESEEARDFYRLETLRTDERGQWQFGEAPTDLAGFNLEAQHPRYQRSRFTPSHQLDSVIVLKKGHDINGRVVDRNERPIKGAQVTLGSHWDRHAPQATTDDHGRFTLENCANGLSFVTVQTEGFAPESQSVHITDAIASLEFRLAPAATLRARVVDTQGNPIAGVTFVARSWHRKEALRFRSETDQNGRIVWSNAPNDEVQYDLTKADFRSYRKRPLIASDQEQTLVLKPVLLITGRVTDAATGQPIPKFRISEGSRPAEGAEIHWEPGGFVSSPRGRYQFAFSEPAEAYYLRVEAPGHKPVDSPAIQPNEPSQNYDFALQPSKELNGVVFGLDDRPAADVRVGLASPGIEFSMQVRRSQYGRRPQDNTDNPVVKTRFDGRFTLPEPDGEFLLIAWNDAGYVEVPSDEFAKNHTLRLKAWGKIEGRVLSGQRPVAHQEVTFHSLQHHIHRGFDISNDHKQCQTDAQGRFAFDQVAPGPGYVVRQLVTKIKADRTEHLSCWPETIEVKPGKTIKATIGGKGRPVIGRAVLDGSTKVRVDWQQNRPAIIRRPRKSITRNSRVAAEFAAHIDNEGRFRIEDVPAGHYILQIPINAETNARDSSIGQIGGTTLDITVPEGPQNQPLDLGEIKVEPYETLQPGDFAPEFLAQRLDGQPFRLSDFQGKLVLLDFWASWLSPQLDNTTDLEEIYQSFGENPKFALFGFACDPTVDQVTRYVQANNIKRPQIHATSHRDKIIQQYKLSTIPARFLIGPDGRILAKNLQGESLKNRIREALEDKALFATAKTMVRPARFPITQFATEAPEVKSVVLPSVVVLDDSDSDLDSNKPPQDKLSLLNNSGQEIHSLNNFNTCLSTSVFHALVNDAARQRIYVAELAADRVTALDLHGGILWQVSDIEVHALAVDPKTGNLWCACGPPGEGETVVLDPSGKELATFPETGVDIVYDPHTDGFWLAGQGITKLNREGKRILHKPIQGWCYVAIDVNPKDGSVWIAERNHFQVPRTANRLWHLDTQGNTLNCWELGRRDPITLAYDPQTSTAFVVNLRKEILRFQPSGKELAPWPIPALAIAISPTSGNLWVNTTEETLRLDQAGQIILRSPFPRPSPISWLAAF